MFSVIMNNAWFLALEFCENIFKKKKILSVMYLLKDILAVLFLFHRKLMMSAKTLVKNHRSFGWINKTLDEMSFDYCVSVCSRRMRPKMPIAHPRWTLFYEIIIMHIEIPTWKINTMNRKNITRSMIITVYSRVWQPTITWTIFGFIRSLCSTFYVNILIFHGSYCILDIHRYLIAIVCRFVLIWLKFIWHGFSAHESFIVLLKLRPVICQKIIVSNCFVVFYDFGQPFLVHSWIA